MSGRAKRQPAAPREDESNWPRGSAASRCWLRASAAEQEGEGPVLVVGQRVGVVPGNAVDAAGHDEGAGCRAVRREVHEVRGENAVGCLVVAELVAGHGCEHAPVVREGVAPLPVAAEPVAVPMPDRDVVQPDVRLRAAKRPEPGQCPTQRLAQFRARPLALRQCEQRDQRRHHRLFVVDLVGRQVRADRREVRRVLSQGRA